MYVSIDKDVLCQEDARTNWDQGDMKLEEMELMVEELLNRGVFLGADICGENPQDTSKITEKAEIEINCKTNRRIWNLFI